MRNAFTYRQTRQGEWVGYGPATITDEINPGGIINILKKDGTVKTETVSRYGKPFRANNGKLMVYAYFDRENRSAWRAPRRRHIEACPVCGEDRNNAATCWECGHHFA